MRAIKSIYIYGAIIALLLLFIVIEFSPVKLKQGVYLNHPQSLTPFELTDQHNHRFTEEKLKGQWTLLFFGFTSCPMVCPVMLETLNYTYDQLPNSDKPQIVLVSVDPQHDTPEHLKVYLHQVNSKFIGLNGPMTSVNALQKQLHVHVSTAPQIHGNEIILINPEGKVQAYFYFPVDPDKLKEDLMKIIN